MSRHDHTHYLGTKPITRKPKDRERSDTKACGKKAPSPVNSGDCPRGGLIADAFPVFIGNNARRVSEPFAERQLRATVCCARA